MAGAHRHDRDAGATAARHELRTWMGAALTFVAAGVELAGGWRTGSAAVAAEGLHMGAHVTAFVLAGLGYVAARALLGRGRARAAARAPDVAAFVNGLLLLVMGGALGISSAAGLQRGDGVAFWPALGLASFGLAINLVSVALLSHSHAHEPGHGRDMNFRAVYLHILGDAAVGLLAVLGLVLGRSFGWRWTDAAAGALGALLLATLGLQVMVRSAGYLREPPSGEAVPPGEDAAARRPRVARETPIR